MVLIPAILCSTMRSSHFGNLGDSEIKCVDSYWKRLLASVGKAMMGETGVGVGGRFLQEDTGS